MPRIGNGGSSRIAHQRHLRPLLQLDYEFRRARDFVVLVIAHQLFLNVEMRKKLHRLARVFAGDQVGFFQNAQCAQRNILEVADRCGDHIEAACSRFLGFYFCHRCVMRLR